MAPARTLLAVLSLLVFIPANPAVAQDDFDQEVRKLLKDALDLYERGKLDEAFVKYQEAFNKKPSSAVVYAHLKQAGTEVIASMMNSPDPRIRDTGLMIFKLAKPGEAIRKDQATIDRYIADLSDNASEVWQLAFFHLKNIGPYAVTSLVPTLAKDTSDRLRPRVILLLTEMHYDATLGVIEALHGNAILMRQNAAIVLGNIRDERALPYLKRMVEDPNEKTEVKRYVYEALTKITGRSSAEWKPARLYYLELAEKFYYSHPTTTLRWQPNDLIWKWDAGEQAVKQRDVPAFAFNEQMCEEVLYDLLDEDPKNAGAWALMAANHFAQSLEAQANLAAAQRAMALGDIEQNDVDRLTTLMKGVERARVLGRLVNRPYLYLALDRSLKDGRSEVAVEIINALDAMAKILDLPLAAVPSDPVRYGGPLVAALTHDDKTVRYAAARVMTRLNPQVRTLGMDLVMPIMIDALGERGIRTVLVVHETQSTADFQWLNGWRRMLKRLNTHPSMATSIPDGLMKAMSFPREDIIMLQYELAHTVVFQESITRQKVTERLYTQLKSDVRTREIPIVLVCRDAQQLAEAQQIYQDAAGFLLQNAASTDVESLLNGIVDAMGDDAKNRADAIAQAAAETLAALDVENCMFPYLQTRAALMGAAGLDAKRKDGIRRPAIRALGHFGDPIALDTLADALNEKSDPKETRLAAARALSKIFRKSGGVPSQKAFTVLKETLNDGDLDIELAAAHSLGNARLTLEQRRDLEKFKRIDRSSGQ